MEEWKDIKGYEGKYQVSNLGNVKSLNYNHTGKERLMKPNKDKEGYLRYGLTKNNIQKYYSAHRLVAEAFIDKIPGKNVVDHINTIRTDNRVENLRWCTQSENNKNELTLEKRKNCKVSEETKLKLSKTVFCVEFNKIFTSTVEASKETGIVRQSINKCCLGKVKSAGKHPVTGEKLHWKYIDLLPCYN